MKNWNFCRSHYSLILRIAEHVYPVICSSSGFEFETSVLKRCLFKHLLQQSKGKQHSISKSCKIFIIACWKVKWKLSQMLRKVYREFGPLLSHQHLMTSSWTLTTFHLWDKIIECRLINPHVTYKTNTASSILSPNSQNFLIKICQICVTTRCFCKAVSCDKVSVFDFYNSHYQTLII